MRVNYLYQCVMVVISVCHGGYISVSWWLFQCHGGYISVSWWLYQCVWFQISHLAASKPDVSDSRGDGRPQLCFQKDDVMADIRLMGKGVLKAISKPAR